MANLIIEAGVPDSRRIAELCAEKGHQACLVSSIYHIPHASDIWYRLSALAGPVIAVTALDPRPAEWILRSHNIGDPPAIITVSADDTAPAERVTEAVNGFSKTAGGLVDLREETAERWYPVIDYSRCTACGACLQFCIFGVYERDDNAVVAVEPDNCKAGCPACARICPNSAIIFPLCDDRAIAGAPGQFVRQDARARKMYYIRTSAECTECGGSGEFDPASSQHRACPECGRPIVGEMEKDDTVSREIDALINELEDLAGGDLS